MDWGAFSKIDTLLRDGRGRTLGREANSKTVELSQVVMVSTCNPSTLGTQSQPGLHKETLSQKPNTNNKRKGGAGGKVLELLLV
jgi:hypothetical protein